jgi:hypothetical protein
MSFFFAASSMSAITWRFRFTTFYTTTARSSAINATTTRFLSINLRPSSRAQPVVGA